MNTRAWKRGERLWRNFSGVVVVGVLSYILGAFSVAVFNSRQLIEDANLQSARAHFSNIIMTSGFTPKREELAMGDKRTPSVLAETLLHKAYNI